MSQETSQWLNNNVLVGFTEKRGNAWHYRKSDQGTEPNHYTGAVPVEDVRRRLFNWSPVEAPITVTVPDAITADGVTQGFTVTDPERKAILHPVTHDIFGIFKSGYVIHDYDEWLTGKVETILDEKLPIGSAGLLKKGAVGWVQIELMETFNHAGVEFRPNLTATTSLDGSLATTYVRGNTLIVCDNTWSAAMGERGALRIKIKHSRYSKARVGEIRNALELLQGQAEEFEEVIEVMTNSPVTDAEWDKFLDLYVPIVDANGEVAKGRSLTMAQNKRDGLNRLWNHDTRVTQWKNTEFGLLQAANTFEQHEGIIRGELQRAERNTLHFLTGKVDQQATDVMDLFHSKVLVSA